MMLHGAGQPAADVSSALHRLSASERIGVLETEVARGAEYCRGLEQSLQNYAGALHATRAGVEEYQAVLRRELTLWRNQRAWQIMLLIRKAYTLWRRSKGEFLGWALGLPFGRIGSLAEQDLVLPDVAGYIPAVPAGGGQGPEAGGQGLATAPVHGPAAKSHYDVVILAIIDFDFRFQRPQQIAAELARRGHRVFWISPTRFLAPDAKDAYSVLPLRDNLWEIHLRSRQPDIYMGELQPDHVEAMSAALDQFCRDWTVVEHAALIQLPFWRRLALQLREAHGSKLVYDCMDDWETFQNMGAFNISEEKQLVRETDVLVVTGAELEKKFEAQGLHPVLARNGADYPFFAKAVPNHLLDGVPRPIVGYFGAIADWIDLDLIYEVARSRPQYSFVLIGQVFGRDVKALESLGNVRLLGNKPYAEIPAYLHGFDACVIPFLLNQVTKATDPVKLYEYFSLGKPVIATDMKELGQCGDLIYIGHSAEDFAAEVDQAVMEKSPDLVQRRIEFAKANTWASRVDQIDGAVRKQFPLVSILIITYNSASFIRPCLDSLFENTSWPRYEVIVVDNASSDQSVGMMKEYAARDPRVRVLPQDKNLGFAGGNNCAAQAAQGEYLVFLNVDTMVTSGWVGRLVRHFERDPSIGLLCPVTNFAGNEVKINVNYTSRREMDQFARCLAAEKASEKIEIPVAPLYCAVMKRPVWERIGEMDTRYEIGMFEDDDLSLRVRQAGFKICTAEDCFIHHFGQGAFSKLDGEAYNRIFEANRRKFEEKWKQPWVVHRTRPGVRAPLEERRFDPASFAAG
jgi:GT2 family glycosyltransferase/glycosyltransferase involved in cell wall biosynthesis